MDFLVGGLPRGGTTASSRILHQAKDTYCYSAETHLVPLMDEFVGFRPAIKEKIPLLMEILRNHNRHVLKDMVEYNVSRGASKEYLVFSDEIISKIEVKFEKILYDGSFGYEAIDKILKYVAELLRRVTGKKIIGEKTPPNTIILEKYLDIDIVESVHIIREPFSSFSSSIKRANDKEDKFNSSFSVNFYDNIGMYIKYTDAMRSIVRSNKSHVFRYEDACTRIGNYIENIISSLSLELDEVGLEKGQRLFQTRDKLSNIDKFCNEEICQTMIIARDALKSFDYSREFFLDYGVDTHKLEIDSESISEGFIPLYGFRKIDGDNAVICERRAKAFVIAPKRQSVLEIEARTVDPALITEPVDELYFDVYSDGIWINRYKLTDGRTRKVVVEIPEKCWNTLGASKHCAVLELLPNFLFRPSTDHPTGRDRTARSINFGKWRFR